MNASVAEQFMILSINPAKGRFAIDNIHFRFTLTGAVLMDCLGQGEFTIVNKRIVPSFGRNGDPLHDMVADRISNSSGNRRISFWINRLGRRSRFIVSMMTERLETKGIIRIDGKMFLGLIPYRRYWFTNRSVRDELVESLRQFLIYGKQPSKNDVMLLGLVDASKAYRLIARENGEVRQMKRRNHEILKGDIMNSEIIQAIREMQAAIMTSVTAATIAARGSH